MKVAAAVGRPEEDGAVDRREDVGPQVGEVEGEGEDDDDQRGDGCKVITASSRWQVQVITVRSL